MRKLTVGLGAALAMATIATAQYVPSWWLDAQNPVLIPGLPSNNLAVTNLGQLKWIAARAADHLNAALPGGAGTDVNNMVVAFTPVVGGSYTPQELADLRAANYAPVNLGQLKAVALPFYDRLLAVGYNTNTNLKANGYSLLWTSNYPWEASPVSENYKPVTLGQLKIVFAFDIVDSNENGTLDYLEGIYPAYSDSRDTDGDGVPDILDVYPNDPSRAILIPAVPGDVVPPALSISNPPGAVLVP